MSELLDCGHPESAHGESTRGYGQTSDGRRHCYDCCLAQALDGIKAGQPFVAYLSGKAITLWPGQILMRVLDAYETSAGGFARRTNITRVVALDTFGRTWYGRGPGNGMYIRMKRYAK